ncbi:hypothetical protein [uncultured Brevundimonas sp.]|uniref:hypothetical protein n=1 Tax=uncultured Brevundimonas sp. TaxID=213418 RepID=UPI0030EC5C0D|tara:strand:- start:1769 stop:2272 length:504 start_codon:yes stop_codon:yes gene_type:complete
MDYRQTIVWLGFGLLAGLATGPGLATGGAPLLPLFLCGLCLACAAHGPSRDCVMQMIGKVLAGSTLRLVLIAVGVALIWQLVGIELAFLMAGDVLAYVEVVAAVSLIAANTRLAPIRAGIVRRIEAVHAELSIRLSGVRRSVRAIRRPARKPSRADDAEGGAVWAFA